MRARSSSPMVAACCVLAAYLFGVGPASSRPAPASPERCELVAASPDYAKDRKLFCAGRIVQPETATIVTKFYVSTNGGKSWQQATAQGLVVDTRSFLGQLVVSPRYTQDRAVYLHTDEGIWRTIDDGATFTLVNALANPGEGRLAPYVEDAPGLQDQGPHTAFAFADGPSTARIDPPLHLPIPASPDDEVRFLIPAGFPAQGEAFVFSSNSDPSAGGPERLVLYSCVPGFSCAVELFRFPEATRLGEAWLAPDYTTSKTIYVEVLSVDPADGGSGTPTMWRSTDAGRTFSPWKSTNPLLKGVPSGGASQAHVGLAVDPTNPREIFLRVSFDPLQYPDTLEESPRVVENPPAEQVFFSRDRGQSWKRVAYGFSYRQKGKSGNLPWNADSYMHPTHMFALPDGKLMTIARRFGGGDSYEGPYCSVDDGRTWAKTCPR